MDSISWAGEAIKGAIDAVELALAAAWVAFVVDAIRRRRVRRSLLQAVLLELMNNRDFLQSLKEMAPTLGVREAANGPMSLPAYTSTDLHNDAFDRAWANDDVRLFKTPALADGLRHTFSHLAILRQAEQDIVRLLDRKEGQIAYFQLQAIARQVPAAIARIDGALLLLKAHGIELPH